MQVPQRDIDDSVSQILRCSHGRLLLAVVVIGEDPQPLDVSLLLLLRGGQGELTGGGPQRLPEGTSLHVCGLGLDRPQQQSSVLH